VRGLHWLIDRHQDLNVDRERIAVFGSSAGGGLAVATALHLRDHGGPPVAYLMLVSPMLDDRSSSPSARTNTGFGAWSREANLQAWRAYLGTHQGGERLSPYAAPARARDVTGLPPTFIDTGELDLLRDEALDLARRLMRAGVPVELHVHPGAIHGGESLAPAAAVSRRARALRIDALTRTFRERTA
jgi:acetyl esterase/lipase